MKKILRLFLLIIVIICCSCSGGNNFNEAIDGQSFDYYCNYETNDNTYSIYLPTNGKESIAYLYEESKTTSDAETWMVNYIYKNEYILPENITESDEVWDGLYNTLVLSKDYIDTLLDTKTSINPNNYSEEKDIVLQNPTKEVISFVNVYKYFPVRIHNQKKSNTFTIMIPIGNQFLIKNGTMVESLFEDKMIEWEEFIKLENVEMKK